MASGTGDWLVGLKRTTIGTGRKRKSVLVFELTDAALNTAENRRLSIETINSVLEGRHLPTLETKPVKDAGKRREVHETISALFSGKISVDSRASAQA